MSAKVTKVGKRKRQDNDDIQQAMSPNEHNQDAEEIVPKIKPTRRTVKLNYSSSHKPTGLGPANIESLVEVLVSRKLLEKRKKWSRSDMNAVANVIQGHYVLYSRGDPRCGMIERFQTRLIEEILNDAYFREITDPLLLIVHTLPDELEGIPPGFDYPHVERIGRQLLPGQRAGGIVGIATDMTNVPPLWYNEAQPTGLVDRALATLYATDVLELSIPADGIPRINTPGAPITFPTPGNPFILEFQSPLHRSHFLAFVRGDLQQRFVNHLQRAEGFSVSSFTTVGPFFHATG